MRTDREPQEAVAEVLSWTNGSYSRNYQLRWLRNVPEGTKLYATPPAQPATPAPISDEQIRARADLWRAIHLFAKGMQFPGRVDDAIDAILAASASQPTPGKSVSDTVGVKTVDGEQR